MFFFHLDLDLDLEVPARYIELYLGGTDTQQVG